jgi:hypothetical protein
MIDPAYDIPLILVPNSVVHGQTFTYMARQLGTDGDDSSNWRIISAVYVREDALTVEVETTELAVLERFYEQIHTARQPQEQPDDCVDPDDCDGGSDTADVPV